MTEPSSFYEFTEEEKQAFGEFISDQERAIAQVFHLKFGFPPRAIMISLSVGGKWLDINGMGEGAGHGRA